jgi:hypothetical protein
MRETPDPGPLAVDVLVGYLVTQADGFEARLGPDRARAELYAVRNHARIEAMFVRRARQDGAGGPNAVVEIAGKQGG